MSSTISLHNLISKYQQEINSHKDNKYISPFPSIFWYFIICCFINTLLFLIYCTYYYFIMLFCLWILNVYVELVTILRHVDWYYLTSSVELVWCYPAVFTTWLADVKALGSLDYDYCVFFSFVFWVFGVYVSLTQYHEWVQRFLELFIYSKSIVFVLCVNW